VIHLATHAYANDRYPSQSYIAFYPILPNTAISHKLYLPEIYNLKLDKAALVVLSACESGSGELVKGEGIMSLSRAFSYAGCNNIITTMWKADDASTAYLSAKLHHYIQKGYTINYALQQARLDYLSDEHIPPSKKLPGYWAHMRMIGSFQKQDSHHYLAFVIGALIIICMAFVLKNRKRFNAPGRYN
jgi:CHAT domain-containing protein